MFSINQAGIPPGTPGVSRSDGLGNGNQVELSYRGPGIATFSFLWVPDDDLTAVSTLSQVLNVATFTPDPDSVGGSYRIKCVVYDNGSIFELIRLFCIRLSASGLRIPALNEKADERASLVNRSDEIIAASEFNEPSIGRFKNGNYGGWYSSYVELVKKVEGLS